ncbi:MAG: hypothetical protein FGM24_08605 [Candidatus Kapabacteria bacterium]|nr:hypothetical protein [Candidatus Kapabacteria bacterium]
MPLRCLIVVLLLASAASAGAQIIDWVPRIPLMQTGWQYPGEAQVVEDSTRDRLMTVGWRLGTVYRSEDNGESWQGQYALGTDVVGKYGAIYVAPDGRYIWHGQTPWNQRVALVSSDGGETWRSFTQDTMVYKDGSYRGLMTIIPPYNIRAYENLATGSLVMSSDLGKTWRRITYPPADNPPVSESREMIAAPNMLYRTGRPYMYRFDASKDTVWTQTRVDGSGRFTKEVGGGVVTAVSNALYVYQTWSDTTPRMLRSWKDEVTGDTIALSIGDVQIFDDSTAYAYDDRGWIFEVRPRTMDIRCIQPFGAALPKPTNGIMLRPSFLWASIYRERCVAITDIYGSGWCVVELKNGKVLRVDTVPSRTPDVVTNGRMPYNYYGERGIFMFKISTGSFREIVRTTDLGASWIHTAKVESEELESTFMGARTSVRDPDGTLLIHTTRDHCVIPDDRGSIERSFRLTDINNVLTQSNQALLFDRASTLYRDGDRVLLAGPTLGEYDYRQGKTVAVVLPRISRFVRRLSSSMLAAGSDSLWFSFNDGREWVHVSATLASAVAQPRGKFSDVCRTSRGTLLAAVRGVDFTDVDERRGTVCYGGIGRSTNNGDTWQWVGSLPDSMRFVTRLVSVNDSTILAVAGRMLVDSAQYKADGTFRAEVAASALLLSTDDGRTWSVVQRDSRIGMSRGDSEPDILALDNGVVLASLFSGSAFMSTTSGRSWSILDLPDLGLGSVYGFRREDNGDIMISTSVGAGYLRLPGITRVETDVTPTPSMHVRIIDGQLHASVAADAQDVQLIGIDGRCVATSRSHMGDATFDMRGLARGLYMLIVTTPNTTQHAPVVW